MFYIEQLSPGYGPIGYTIKRLADGFYYDSATAKFVAVAPTANPPAPAPLTQGKGIYASVYATSVPTTDAAVFPAGEYGIYIHILATGQAIEARAVRHEPGVTLFVSGFSIAGR